MLAATMLFVQQQESIACCLV